MQMYAKANFIAIPLDEVHNVLSNSTFASRQLPAVKYIISRSKMIAHPSSTHVTPSLNPSPRVEGLAFTASSEEEWCFVNAKLELVT